MEFYEPWVRGEIANVSEGSIACLLDVAGELCAQSRGSPGRPVTPGVGASAVRRACRGVRGRDGRRRDRGPAGPAGPGARVPFENSLMTPRPGRRPAPGASAPPARPLGRRRHRPAAATAATAPSQPAHQWGAGLYMRTACEPAHHLSKMSALLEFLLQTPLGTRVEARLFRDRDDIHAPDLAGAEVAQGLRRLVRTGEVSEDRAADAIDAVPRGVLSVAVRPEARGDHGEGQASRRPGTGRVGTRARSPRP